MNTYIPPPSAFSSQIGAHLSKKLIKCIRNNTFVDFSDLLPLQQCSALHADELELSVDSKNNPCFIKKQSKKSLSFLMWSEAYNSFQLIYIETHPSKSTKELLVLTRKRLTYRKHIIDIVKQGGDWLQYDKHFRSEMVNRRDSWSTIPFDLLMTYNFNYKQKVSQKSQGHTTKQKLTNTCVDYNVRGGEYVLVLFVPTLTVVLYVCSNIRGRPIRALRMSLHMQLEVILTVHLLLCSVVHPTVAPENR